MASDASFSSAVYCVSASLIKPLNITPSFFYKETIYSDETFSCRKRLSRTGCFRAECHLLGAKEVTSTRTVSDFSSFQIENPK